MFREISYLLVQALALIVGIVIHESAHALVAYLLGDRTARDRGRVSLNPLAHIDSFGTVILPILMLLAGGPVFAFAKPVPVYLDNLRNPRRDEVLVSLAGPASNLLLALLAAVLLGGVASSPAALSLSAGAIDLVFSFLLSAIVINLSLAFFNLIPLPPLDGSSIIAPFLRGRARDAYYQVQRYSMPILIIVLYLIPEILHIDIIGLYFDVTVYPLAELLLSTFAGW